MPTPSSASRSRCVCVKKGEREREREKEREREMPTPSSASRSPCKGVGGRAGGRAGESIRRVCARAYTRIDSPIQARRWRGARKRPSRPTRCRHRQTQTHTLSPSLTHTAGAGRECCLHVQPPVGERHTLPLHPLRGPGDDTQYNTCVFFYSTWQYYVLNYTSLFVSILRSL
jgi:hypothetical protein